MPTLQRTLGGRAPGALARAFRTFADEAGLLAQALLSPGRIIEEVEQMRALQRDASRIECVDPVRAALLRRRAAAIGLR